MPLIVLDTGFLFSLVVDRSYSDAAREHWSQTGLWVPESVVSELKYRVRNPGGDVPPELPRYALGLIGSSDWHVEKVELTDDEQREAEALAQRLGGGPLEHRGECEGAILIARNGAGILATDDVSSIPVLSSYVHQKTTKSIVYVTTSAVLDELVGAGRLTPAERGATGELLRKKGRPFT